MRGDPGQMEVSELFLQLVSSLRNIEGRLDELKNLVATPGLPAAIKAEKMERITNLIDARMKLLYSLMDCRLSIIGYCDNSTAIDVFDQDVFTNLIRSFRHTA